MVAFSVRTGAWRGFADWNVAYERVFEYGEALDALAAVRADRVLDVGGDISVFGCYVAQALGSSVDIVDMSDLAYCGRVRARLAPDVAERVTLIPKRTAESLGGGSYDAVTCISAMEHFDDGEDLAFVRRAADLVRVGGVLVVSAPFTNDEQTHVHFRDSTYYDAAGVEASSPELYMRCYSEEGLKELFDVPAFELERIVFGGEIVNFFDRVYLWEPRWRQGRWRSRLATLLVRLLRAPSPLYPFATMRSSDDPRVFTVARRRRRIYSPDVFVAVLRRAAAPSGAAA
jgi:hypothetical protein